MPNDDLSLSVRVRSRREDDPSKFQQHGRLRGLRVPQANRLADTINREGYIADTLLSLPGVGQIDLDKIHDVREEIDRIDDEIAEQEEAERSRTPPETPPEFFV